MENIHLTQYKNEDFKEISQWEKQYFDTPQLDAIMYYILGGMSFKNLSTALKTLNDTKPIGHNELSKVLLARNTNEEIVGILVADIFGIKKSSPELYIQYLIVNPKFQNYKDEKTNTTSKHSGNGTHILKEFLLNAEQLYGIKPKKVFANIEPTNERSKAVFKNLGFGFEKSMSSLFTQAKQDYDILLEKIKEERGKIYE